MDSQNDNSMQYAHISRDDSNGSTPFQAHQGLNQALGNHLAPPPPQYARGGPDPYRHPSTSPPTLNQAHAGPSGHQGITFTVANNGQTSPALKRKQMDPQTNAQLIKRRKDGEDVDAFDDAGGQGAKHWTDEEKTKLFRWLMGPNNDDHWAALRATKNSCLRECAEKVFDRKKSYQALKGCYERNFNLFKQIYALDASTHHSGAVMQPSEADRLREYERRLQIARKNGCDVGNITSRTIEHWFSRGWYELFYRRWHGDPATTRPVQTRSTGGGNSVPQGGDDQDDDDPSIDYSTSDPNMMVNGLNGMSHDRPPSHQVAFINPQQPMGRDVSQMPPTPATASGQVPMVSTPSMQHMPPGGLPSNTNSNNNNNNSTNNSNPNHHHHHPQPSTPSASLGPGPGQAEAAAATALMPIPFSPQAVNALMGYFQSQTQLNKMKMEYMRRREEREEKEHRTKLETSRIQLEKEKIDIEERKNNALMKQKSEKAVELLGRPEVDGSVKAAASEYLRKLFITNE